MKLYASIDGLKQFLIILVLIIVFGFGQNVALAQEEISTTSTSSIAENITDDNAWLNISRIAGNDIAVGDYVVGPGKIEVEVSPGETVTRFITVTNRMSDDRRFDLAVEDMSGSVDGSSNVVLLGDVDGPYSLKDYISFSKSSFTINLGDKAQVPVQITMPPNAEPGGYYGAVLVSTVQNDSSQTSVGAPRTPIVARIGTLFFIRVPGKAEVSGGLVDFSTKNNQRWYQNGPIDLNILYENIGSVHLNPYGEIRITNMLGEEVGFVELDPWFVLPKSLRLREITWNRELLLGRYEVTVKINRGYGDIIDEKTIHIWVLPWTYLLITFSILFSLFLLARFILRTFEFKRRV